MVMEGTALKKQNGGTREKSYEGTQLVLQLSTWRGNRFFPTVSRDNEQTENLVCLGFDLVQTYK